MQNKKGNILFLILIAVALFAALSYAVTNTSRSNSQNISEDKAKILAADIIQYAAQVEQGISRLRVINNVSEHGLDLVAPSYSTSTNNGTCTTDACKLFNVVGGNISPRLLPQDAWDMSNTNMTTNWQGRMEFRVLRIQDVGIHDEAELTMIYRGINDETCAAINERLNIANDSDGTPPTDSTNTYELYSGTLTSFPVPAAGITFGDQAAQFIGQRTFCTDNGAANHFVHVLIAR
jgi:hypothetical protein